jgi:hypothetical protein
MMNKKLLVFLSVLGAFLIIGAVVGTVQAQGMPKMPMPGMSGMHGPMMPLGQLGIAGTVSAVNGTTLSVASVVRSRGLGEPNGNDGNNGNGNSLGLATSSVTYSVDASNATVRKNNATTTVSSIGVGDMVYVRGSVSGTSVTATTILDGIFGPNASGTSRFHGGPGPVVLPWKGVGAHPTGTRPFAGATPMTTGTIASVNGSTLTMTTGSGTTYSIDATNATLVKQGTGSNSISAIAIGDNVQVEGSVSGTVITARVIFDNVPTPSASGSATSSNSGSIMGAIRSFLANIFRF